MNRMPVTEADFQLQGRIDNYREQLFELLVALDALVQAQLGTINQEKLGGRGRVSYETRPPRWTLAWRAFALALVVGAAVGLALVRFVPLFGGTLPTLAPVRAVLPFTPIILLFLLIVVGRLVQQAVPVTIGFIGGGEAVVATVLLVRSLRAMRESTTRPR